MAGVSGPADDPASRGTDRRPLDCQTRRTLLEPDAARVASPVLRRARRREAPGLSDQGRRSRDGRSPPGSSRADEDADCNGGERLAWPDASVSKGSTTGRSCGATGPSPPGESTSQMPKADCNTGD